MKETKFLGSLMPTHPDFLPIVQKLREKYSLWEVNPEGEPITEIYLGDRLVPFEDFHKEIEMLVRKNPNTLPPEVYKMDAAARRLIKPLKSKELRGVPNHIKKEIENFYALAQNMAKFNIAAVDGFVAQIADMLYIYLLTGETEEVPNDWISKVTTITDKGEDTVIALASQLVNPDVIVQQFKAELKKTFKNHRSKVTQVSVSTAYYMQLQRAEKKWDFIVEEFIRLNKYSLPRDRSSKRYAKVLKMYSDRLKKRIERSEVVLEILLRDKK
jgi:hypothetical protein